MNIYPKEWDLNLEGDAFNALKNDFNMVLRKTLSNMESKSSELAELTVKVKISLKKEKAPGTTGSEIPRDIVVPKFDHKVSSVMQIKSEVTGSLGGEYELVWDSERGEYVMREIVNPQMTIFEYGHETYQKQGDILDGDYTEPSGNQGVLEGRNYLALPDNSAGNVGCAKDFPDCVCLACKHKEEDNENGTCCTNHSRDCQDTNECVDYEAANDSPENANNGYEYDDPNKEADDEQD